MDTKECRHCKQPIHAQARICQHCKGSQSWIANQTDPRFLAMTLGLIVLIVVPLFILLSSQLSSLTESAAAPAVLVTGTSVRYTDTPEGARVFVLGRIQNTSRVDASRIWFRVELFDASDRLLDTLLQEQSGLVVPGSGSKPFRITGLISVAPTEVKRTAVSVERVRERGKYD